MFTDEEIKKAADFISKPAAWFAVYSAENGQKNNGHTIQKDCVTVIYISCFAYATASTFYWRGLRMAACAAARRAIGTRNGEQET